LNPFYSLGKLFSGEKRAVTINESGKSPVSRFMDFFGSGGVDGSFETDDLFSLTAAWRAIRVLGESFATLPIAVYKYDDEGMMVRADHYLNNILSTSPNPIQTPFVFFEQIMTHCNTEGNFYAIKEVDEKSGRVKALRVISPGAVESITIADDYLLYKIDGYKDKIRSEKIIHVPGLGFNGVVGFSPVEVHRQTLLMDKSSKEYGKNFYQNGASVSGALTVEGELDDDAYNRLRDSWRAAYSGPANAGKTAILEGGTKFQPISLNPADAEWLGSRQRSSIDIANIFGVPVFMLNEMERATWDNVEHMGLHFIKHTLTPWVRRVETEFNRKLFNENERGKYFVRFDMMGLLRGDLDTMGDLWIKMFNVTAMTGNEMRSQINMPPYEGGSRRWIQINNYAPLDRVDEMIDQRATPKIPVAADDLSEQNDSDDQDG
jgi:HK97 family phage portal protein